MKKNEVIHVLQRLRTAFEEMHMDYEAQAMTTAIYDIGILDDVKKERDAAIAELRQKGNGE